MKILENIKEKIINYVYTVSKQPVLYRDLLRANSLYNEGMYVDPGILNFRKNINRAYVAYGVLCALVLLPLLALTHTVLSNMNFHISVIGTIFVTSSVFIGFTFFTAWIRDGITKKLIKEAWKLHFPYFVYDKYSQKVETIYQKARKEEVSRRELEKYVLDALLVDK